MADEPTTTPGGGRGEPEFEQSLMRVRKRRRRLDKAKRAAEEVTYLNIVAMVDILTILLIFLLKSVSVSSSAAASNKNLALPFSTTKVSPIEAAKVFVTRTKVIVEEKEVAQIFNGAIENRWLSPSNNYLVPGLEDALKNWLAWHLFFKGKDGQGKLSLEILADKDTPYHVIMQVLYTAGRAVGEKDGHSAFFSNYRLMVMRAM